MSLRVVRAVGRMELSDDLHLGRLLVLLRASGGRTGTKAVAGLMKVAKLDFLLRYPNCLDRVLRVTGGDVEAAEIKPHERQTIETKMVRFRYGPWDERYRRWVGLLVARGLAVTYVQGKTIHVGLIEKGVGVADRLGKAPEFNDLHKRSQLIAKAVGAMTATRLKEFVYEQFPELLDMRWGEEIEL